MGCNCGCPDDHQVQEFDDPNRPVHRVMQALYSAMDSAYDVGFRDGALTMADVAELSAGEDGEKEADTELENMVEADAVVLDAVLMQVQDIAGRLAVIEMNLGLKYIG